MLTDVDSDDGGAITSGQWKKLRSKFEPYRHLLIEGDKLEVHVFLNVLLHCLVASTRTGAQLFAAPSGDLTTLGATTLRNGIASLELQFQAGGEKLKARESNLICRLSNGSGRVRKASASSKLLFKRQLALELEVAFLRE